MTCWRTVSPGGCSPADSAAHRRQNGAADGELANHSQQDIYLGRPIPPEDWQPLNLRDRRQRLLDAINQLGPSNDVEEPFAPDPVLASAAVRWSEQTGVDFGLAVIFTLLQQLPDPSPEVAAVLAGAQSGVLHVPGTAEGQWPAELARRLYGPHGPKVTS